MYYNENEMSLFNKFAVVGNKNYGEYEAVSFTVMAIDKADAIDQVLSKKQDICIYDVWELDE